MGKRHTPITQLISSGAIKRPDGLSSVHLFRAISSLCGYDGAGTDGAAPGGAAAHGGSGRETSHVKTALGEYNHYVFVLIDGMGAALSRFLPEGGWFARAEKSVLSSVYPSTTAVALTSQATCLWPSEHGVTGWHTYLPDHDLTVLPLKASERFSRKPLKSFGLGFRDVVQPESVIAKYRCGKRIFMKKAIRGGAFGKWAFFGITKTGSSTFAHSFKRLRGHVRNMTEPAYSHLYIDDIDSMSHRHGPSSTGVRSLIGTIDKELSQLRDAAGEHVRIIVTADHGHIEVDPERHYLLHHDDPLLRLLKVPPSGESRNPIFHVVPGRESEFQALFSEKYGADFLLVTPEDIESEKLMGPEPFNEVTRRRIGTFVGLAKTPAAIEFIQKDGESKGHKGMHGGLSPQEIEVPLFLL